MMTRHSIPTPATPFVGRARELEAIERFLDEPSTRLVTITGQGGVGKTRLALEVARRLRLSRLSLGASAPRFPDGIFFIPLAPVEDRAHIAPRLATMLPITLQREEHRSLRQQLLDYLEHKQLLLILDNFDHLIEEAALIAQILQAAPDVQILVTSRERLRLRSEQVLPLRGLQAVDGEQAAVTLFLAAARRRLPDYGVRDDDLVHLNTLCELVQGMPLALELAATWVDLLPLAEISERVASSLDLLEADVRDFPERHRSMRAVFDASWAQLAPHEQKIVAGLSVFRGGFTRAAAEAVVEATVQSLARLDDRSLLRYEREQGRYTLHELLRQYAAEKLAGTPAAAVTVRDRHLLYFLSLAEKIEGQLAAGTRPTRLDLLEADRENMRVALKWAAEREDAEALARLSGALGGFWGIRGYLQEGQKWLNAAVARRERVSTEALAGVFFACGWLAFERGDYTAARQYYEESHRMMVESGETGRVAEVLSSLGHVAQQEGDYAHAAQLVEESLALYEAASDKGGIAYCLNRLGRLAELRGDYAGAVTLIGKSLALRRKIGDERGIASCLNALAELARYQEQHERAEQLYRETLAICLRLGDKRCVAGVNHNLGHMALQARDATNASKHFRESLLLYRELDNIEGVALCLAGFGAVYGLRGQSERAARFLSAATRLFELNSVVMTVADQAAYEQNLAQVRVESDEDRFARGWAAGQTMTVEDAVGEALSS